MNESICKGLHSVYDKCRQAECNSGKGVNVAVGRGRRMVSAVMIEGSPAGICNIHAELLSLFCHLFSAKTGSQGWVVKIERLLLYKKGYQNKISLCCKTLFCCVHRRAHHMASVTEVDDSAVWFKHFSELYTIPPSVIVGGLESACIPHAFMRKSCPTCEQADVKHA